ncbi:unnamed protein product [Adineta steineri]|uniref:Uncharacterized protein n=1 Tax=Adineta steineri TaxID=433720 RepID=A0A814SIY3_9BILA|nr:unnamed protein product [Adineta steineri]CAF3626668.1 unnamed protein product [Adineta steineri]
MTKRPFNIENKENEPESNSIPTKKAKTIDSHNEPELNSILKKTAKINDSQNEPEQEFTTDDEDRESYNESDFSQGDNESEDSEIIRPLPISSIIERHDGAIHPDNKQYYIYTNTDLMMISHTARFWSRKYLKIFPHVDPDTYDMYIHNDFICYGELEIIENCLVDIAKGTYMKHKDQMNMTNYITTFRRVEALTVVLQRSSNFTGIDDGQRFHGIIRVIGACYVTILVNLLPKSMFDNTPITDDHMRKLIKFSQQIPNFKQVIKQALILGHMLLSIGSIVSAYTTVLQTVYCKWSLIMDQITIDLNKKHDEEDEEIWQALKHASGISKHAFKESFNFLKELDLYTKAYPDLGGHSHDISKWSKTRRSAFLSDSMDDEPVGSFWSRL